MSLAVSHSASLPAHEEFKRRLGRAIELKNQKRYSEAAQILEELRATHPESASVYGLLGHALWELNDPVRAVHSFRKAVKLSPESELASLGLFHTLMETGEKKGALQEMNRFRRVADSKEYEAIAKEFGVQAVSAQPKTVRIVPNGLEALEEQIDDCLTVAKNMDREGLDDVIRLLRNARNEVVWKMGQ